MGAIDLFAATATRCSSAFTAGAALPAITATWIWSGQVTYRRYAQFFALYGQPEDFAGTALEGITHQEIFRRGAALFQREMEANAEKIIHCRSGGEANRAFSAGKAAAFLSVEGAELLGCSLEGLEQARDLGVRAVHSDLEPRQRPERHQL